MKKDIPSIATHITNLGVQIEKQNETDITMKIHCKKKKRLNLEN